MSETNDTNNMNTPDTDTNEQQQKRSEIPKTLGFIMTFAGIFFLIASLFSLLTLLYCVPHQVMAGLSRQKKFMQ